jgi:hypothetical protein
MSEALTDTRLKSVIVEITPGEEDSAVMERIASCGLECVNHPKGTSGQENAVFGQK